MPAMRCSTCAINYPTTHNVCPVCRERTWFLTNSDVDEDWTGRVKQIKAQLEEAAETVYPHLADNRARIYSGKGLLWVTHAELLACGYRNIEAGTIVFLNLNFYEVEGYAEKARSWWIKEVVVDGAAESLEPSMFYGDDAETA